MNAATLFPLFLSSSLIHKKACSHHRKEFLTSKTFGGHKQAVETQGTSVPAVLSGGREMVVGWLGFWQQ